MIKLAAIDQGGTKSFSVAPAHTCYSLSFLREQT